MRYRLLMLSILLLVPLSAAANEDPLDTLWPNDDGLRFDFDYHYSNSAEGFFMRGSAFLAFEGTTAVPGGLAQNLTGDHTQLPISDRGLPAPGLDRWLWMARPDLRPALAAKADRSEEASWTPLFLHTGYYLETSQRLEMWQDSWSHPTWTYVAGPVAYGMAFTHQLVPELVDDVFLHGIITDMHATVSTPAGEFTNAVTVTYLIDYGVGEIHDESSGGLIGSYHSETRGHVAFVPGVGPVEMLEEFTPYVWLDCGSEPCDPELADQLGEVVVTQTLELSQTPVANEDLSWGEVKSLYR